jgi:hypothetical protein
VQNYQDSYAPNQERPRILPRLVGWFGLVQMVWLGMVGHIVMMVGETWRVPTKVS